MRVLSYNSSCHTALGQDKQGLLDVIFFHKGTQDRKVYRTYASLYFIIGCDPEDNEFSLLELIQFSVECMDQYFEKVTELDLVYNLEKVHMIMDEIVVKGLILETNHDRVLALVYALDQKKLSTT
ncbi:clathrin adaptor complex small chain-domain-containing protein [Pilaira anomala]|nr:clathrin adaptor complex small chain-domain-containing protein [Pilaira anomala]